MKSSVLGFRNHCALKVSCPCLKSLRMFKKWSHNGWLNYGGPILCDVCMYLCVYACVYFSVWLPTHAHMWTCSWQLEVNFEYFLLLTSTLSFGKGSLTEPGPRWFSWTLWRETPWILLSPQCWDYRHNSGYWESELGSCVCEHVVSQVNLHLRPTCIPKGTDTHL